MPSLHWIGKDKVINHHQDVPFRILEHQYHFENGVQTAPSPSKTVVGSAGNKIIHGDNLEALKALLPQYEGKIKCIYIDPPYNTGNEGWIYNDNVNDPKINKWINNVVGKEGDDLSRHDKWLCMMYPRLQLLYKLLAYNGAILISIDDNEIDYLKLILNEIFGAANFIGSFIWNRRQNADSRNVTRVSTDHEYVLAYSKSITNISFKGRQIDLDKYKNPDNDPRGPWASIDLSGLATKEQRPNLHYNIIDPKTGIEYPPNPRRGWSKSKETLARLIENGEVLFPKNSAGRPRQKKFLKDLQNETTGLSSILDSSIVGFTTHGSKVIADIFKEKAFDFPKPVDLIQLLVDQTTDKNSIVLDSFAGSGTTAHAVLKLNKQDGGNRKVILVEMEDYAETITAERVKRVITGYADVEGSGGSFDYYTLGVPLFDEAQNLNDEAPEQKIREYVYYSETKQHLSYGSPCQLADNKYLLDKWEETAFYFYYEKQSLTTLDDDFLATISTKAGQYIIYADNCLLSKAFMQKKNIIFKKIPRDITRF